MRIAVLIKQVPMVSKMEFDPESKTLKREGVPNEVSSFDVRALVKAVELARAANGEVVAVTMGPPQAEEALIECLALGADRAVHLCDRAFAGADTLATARALAAALRREPFDLVLCGRHSVDAETGQVGPEVAELLGMPQITAASRLDVDWNARRLEAERETDDGFETVEASLPALVSATEDLAPEKFSRKDEREAAKSKPIARLTAADLSLAAAEIGQLGSPTWVTGLETVTTNRLQQVLEGDSVEAIVDRLVGELRQRGLFRGWEGLERERTPRSAARVTRAGAKDVWVVAEVLGGKLRPVTFELLGKAAELAARIDASVTAVLLGSKVESLAEGLCHCGADRVMLAADARLGSFATETWTAILARAIETRRPGMVLMPSTSGGRDVAPRIAARLGLGLTGDCVGLDLDGEGRLLQLKPAFGGNVVAPILSKTLPEMATIRAGFLEARAPDRSRRVEIERLDTSGLEEPRTRVVSKRTVAEAATELDHAEVVVGIGKGIGGAAQIDAVRPLAGVLDAAICATREVTDDGWLPRQYQVGLTGRAVAPKLYVAIAIRGATEHMVGVRRAGLIVGINKNPKAPLFKAVDYGIVGDFAEVVPLLAEKLRQVKPR